MTSIRVDSDLIDQAVKVLGATSRAQAVKSAFREIVGLKRFRELMSNNGVKA